MVLRKVFCLLLILPVTAGAFESALLPEEIGAAMRARKVPASGVSIFVQEVGVTEPLLAIDAAKARNPASVIKLLTTWAALEELSLIHI